MSAVLEPRATAGGAVDVAQKLAFSKKLQAVTNRIHSTQNVDERMLDVSRDICQLFEADRMTIYTTSEDLSSIVSKVKTGLNSFKDIKLPISESSMAGFCALNRRHMNIRDVSDDAGLRACHEIRQTLGNRSVRILLRTGQPGAAPERLPGFFETYVD